MGHIDSNVSYLNIILSEQRKSHIERESNDLLMRCPSASSVKLFFVQKKGFIKATAYLYLPDQVITTVLSRRHFSQVISDVFKQLKSSVSLMLAEQTASEMFYDTHIG